MLKMPMNSVTGFSFRDMICGQFIVLGNKPEVSLLSFCSCTLSIVFTDHDTQGALIRWRALNPEKKCYSSWLNETGTENYSKKYRKEPGALK